MRDINMGPEAKTVVALIALSEEYNIFQEVFPSTHDRSIDRLICLEHESGSPGIRLISVLAEQMGSQSASHSAEVALAQFSPDLIVVIGIAGAVTDDLNLADVCISNEILDVLQNAKVSGKSGSLDISFAPNFYGVDAELIASFAFLKSHPNFRAQFDQWKLDTMLAAEKLGAKQLLDGADFIIGPIACGPVAASTAFTKKLKSLHRKVSAIETESGGIFDRLLSTRTPAIAIRGISDLADEKKAELEQTSKGSIRRLAMLNASTLLKVQLQNAKFLDVAARFQAKKLTELGYNGSLNSILPQKSVISEIERETTARLKELSADFRNKADGFYLPIPRVRRISYTDDLSDASVITPENIVDCLREHDRILVKLPRTFPGQALGWSLAHSLLRQQIDNKVVLPFVVSGPSISAPKNGLERAIPSELREAAAGSEYIKVFIIEEPSFESRSRMSFLASEVANTNAKVMIVTKTEDSVSSVDKLSRDLGLTEFEISPISFAETAFFLEKTFDMSPSEAESVAIRLDDTFRKFRLDAHPTYFAGLQEETLSALINANKRAELIQLAVDGLLTLIVAFDDANTNLSRTTRERFLKLLVTRMAESASGLTDLNVTELAITFLKEHLFDVPHVDFLSPFFRMGILYKVNGIVKFSHIYLECYLLAQSLRENPDFARDYFNPTSDSFNYYAFDLYCEMGADAGVIENVLKYAEYCVQKADTEYPNTHVYSDHSQKLTSLSSQGQIAALVDGLVENAKRLEKSGVDENVRTEKQRLLDARRHVHSEVNSRDPRQAPELPDEIKKEFAVLDGLSRALSLCATAVGSGSESLNGDYKSRLANYILAVAARFSDIWTRNRLRIDFKNTRSEIVSDENIWKFMDDMGIEKNAFEIVKRDIEFSLYGLELNTILEPMGQVLWRISSMACAKVLSPVLDKAAPKNEIEEIIRGSWHLDVNPSRGKDVFKKAMTNYSGNSVLRIVLASHLLWRVFWHHYKTPGSPYFVQSARRALTPLGLRPSPKRLEHAKKGPHA